MNKEIKEIVRRLEANGYVVSHGGKHLKVKNPEGATIYTLPTTPSGSVSKNLGAGRSCSGPIHAEMGIKPGKSSSPCPQICPGIT